MGSLSWTIRARAARTPPLLGVFNRAARNAIESEGDLDVLGEELATICQNLLEYDDCWRSAANEGDIFWKEEEAGDYWTELFTDSAGRYLSEPDLDEEIPNPDEPLSLPVTNNLVAMFSVAFEGEVPDLETDLASIEALTGGLKALINLHYQEKLRAVQVHFSPARFGDELSEDELIENFPELIPL